MYLGIDNFIRVSGETQFKEMKERLESSNTTYTIVDIGVPNGDEPNELSGDYYFLILDNKKEKQNKDFYDKWLSECTEILKSIKLLENYWKIAEESKNLRNNQSYMKYLITDDMAKRADIKGALEYLKTAETIKNSDSPLFDKLHSCSCNKKEDNSVKEEPPCKRIEPVGIFDSDLWRILRSL